MFARLRHNWKLALPLLATTGGLVLSFKIVQVWGRLALDQRSDSLALARIAEGIDVVSSQSSGVLSSISRLAQHGDIIFYVATTATAISLLSVLVHLADIVHGTGDATRFIKYLYDRITLTSANYWGNVRDVGTDNNLPLARIRLVGRHGGVLEDSISDIRGRYGFKIPLQQAYENGYSLEVVKSGYYFPPKEKKAQAELSHYYGGALPVTTAVAPQCLDVYLEDSANHAKRAILGSRLSAAAFWISVASVPFAVISSSTPVAWLLGAGLSLSLCARISGLGKVT